jgi:hypothetical protein
MTVKVILKCYHLVNVISFSKSQSNHIKQHPLHNERTPLNVTTENVIISVDIFK